LKVKGGVREGSKQCWWCIVRVLEWDLSERAEELDIEG